MRAHRHREGPQRDELHQHPVRRLVARRPVTAYLVLACAASWAWWVPMALTGAVSRPGTGWPTHLPGLLGPALAAVAVTALVDGKPGLADLGRRLWVVESFRGFGPAMVVGWLVGLLAAERKLSEDGREGHPGRTLVTAP